ncbi:hypothetical protein CI109_100881 [Kwoniella shandongensis]|uniref:Uncharacterized protein n=1 Tax=Kwoniella shandongensis TaxID=1734106 RepID=A0A5M6BTN0_9TREE|nr:uncharacterized protein CI109_006134 [Kwoniella shandongensis]KAA5525561.1 hypothetical protein CI109_006134 [Kwoniella shandongensis]
MPALVERQNVSATPTSSPGGTSRSSTTTSSATSSYTSPAFLTGAPSGGSTTLYLFTFLITILVLGLIATGLIVRAYIMRRRYHRRVEEAIRRGERPPPDAAAALGMFPRRVGGRGKKERPVGLMPTLWEGEMYRNGEKWAIYHDEDGDAEEREWQQENEKNWNNLTPLSVLHFKDAPPATQTEESSIVPPPPPLTPQAYLRSLFSSTPMYPPAGTPFNGQPTTQEIPKAGPVFEVPPTNTEVVVGVMIAMPVQGAGEERWNLLEYEGEERDLPEVCLGVMSAKLVD